MLSLPGHGDDVGGKAVWERNILVFPDWMIWNRRVLVMIKERREEGGRRLVVMIWKRRVLAEEVIAGPGHGRVE